VDAIWHDAQGFKPGSQIAHEGGGSADIEIAIARQVEFLKQPHIQATRCVEINIGSILAIGRAVANVAVVVGQRIEQPTRLLRKGMF
jgi:hypothetical protein